MLMSFKDHIWPSVNFIVISCLTSVILELPTTEITEQLICPTFSQFEFNKSGQVRNIDWNNMSINESCPTISIRSE